MRRHVRLAALAFSIFIFVSVLILPDAAPTPALAQTCTGSTSSFAVYPPNAAAGSMVVVATADPTHYFVPGTYANLVGWGTLASTPGGTPAGSTLTVEIPAGVPSGTYTLEVQYPANNPPCVSFQIPIQGPTPTPTGTPYIRPIVTVLSYASSIGVLYPGMEFDIDMTIQNTGALTARNVIVAFKQGDVVPRDTGGLRSLGDIPPGGTVNFQQPMRANSTLGGYEAVIDIEIRYDDQYGAPYADASTLSFEARTYGSTATPVPTPTPTATLSVRPQIIVEGYTTDPEVLLPGTVFDLNLNVVNASGEPARQVVVSLRQSEISLASIAPLSAGNVRYVAQMSPGADTTVTFQMAVNGDAEGGLVPVNVELSYIDNYNVQHAETQTVSLAVNAKPHLQVGLFEPLPNFIQVGDTFDLPVEVINIGTQSVNVSTVEVVGDDRVTLENASVYLGPLDGGTSGTLIATVTALEAGSVPLEIQVHYLNSFQQQETLSTTITVEVEEGPPSGGPDGENGSGRNGEDEGEEAGSGELTVGERLWRAFLGFLGLGTRDPEATLGDLAVPQPAPEERRGP